MSRSAKRSLAGSYLPQNTSEHLIRHFTRNPDSLRLIRAVLSARFHDPGARRSYEEVFRKDLVRALLTVFHLASELGLLRETARPQDLADLSMAGFEQAVADSFTDEGLRRFSASLRKTLAVIGALASR
jgi:hypothetical protein